MTSDPDISLLTSSPLSAASRRELSSLGRTSEDPSIEVPSVLQQMNCGGKYYIIWDTDQAEVFISWWDQLPEAKKCRQPGSKKAHPCWNNARRTSKNWQHFHQAAEKKTGIPGMICKKCHTVIAHPTYSRGGPSGMNKHIGSKDCLLNATANRTNTQDVSLLLVSQFI